MIELPSIESVHKACCQKHNIPYVKKNLKKDLAGNCYAVALVLVEMLKEQKINARAVYGTWKGHHVTEKKKGFFRHGWVLINEKEIIDPTLWVFKAEKPFVFKGHTLFNKEYDEGMKELRSMIDRPFPNFDPKSRRIITFKWTKNCAEMIQALSGKDCQESQETSIEQAFWMANVDCDLWSESLNEIYTNLEKEGCAVFIPSDFKSKWRANKKD